MKRETPEFYESILAFAREEEAPTAVKIGGWLRQPRLAFSYLLAARLLILGAEATILDEVAVPVAYLQRHALELGMKDLIAAAYDVQFGRQWLDWLERAGADATPPTKHKPARDHRFQALHEELKAVLDDLGYEAAALLRELEEVGGLMTEIENGCHTLFRYGPFERPTTLHLGESQDRLESFFARELWVSEITHAANSDAVLAALALESVALEQRIYAITQRLL